MFELFDPHADYRVTAHNLPHWYQPGVTYFVTFRTSDSLPMSLIGLWHRKRSDWLQRHGIDPAKSDWRTQFELLPTRTRRDFHEQFSAEFLGLLDRGHGACLLRDPQLSAVVGRSLLHFDGERYSLGDFVVMPNHVHLLVGLHGETDIEEICASWKRFTAREINRLCGRTGRFWQEESFDHLVRSQEQFVAIQRYIAENPRKAGLLDGQFLHYRPGDEELKSKLRGP